MCVGVDIGASQNGKRRERNAKDAELRHWNFWPAARASHQHLQRRHGRPTLARSAAQHNTACYVATIDPPPRSLPIRDALIPDNSMRDNIEIAARKEEEGPQHIPSI